MKSYPLEKMLRWNILDNGNTRTDDEGDFVYFLDAADMISQYESRVAELEAALEALIPFMEIAFGAEGDTFGIQHNNANDALSTAERLLRYR